MAISMKDLRKARNDAPPRILILAPQGLGKTSLASEFPAPVFLQCEEGTPAGMEIDSFGHLESYGAVLEAIQTLHAEPHDFKTVVLDTADRFEPMLWAQLCADRNWATIEAPGYGKGYAEADYYWRDVMGWLLALRRDRGMAIVILAHTDVTRFDDPQTASYSKYTTRMHKRAAAIIEDEMDAILFINTDTTIKEEEQGFNKTRSRAESGGTRWIYTDQRPAFVAKNRYGMPAKILYRPGQGFSELAKYFPGGSGASAEEPEPQAEKPATKQRKAA